MWYNYQNLEMPEWKTAQKCLGTFHPVSSLHISQSHISAHFILIISHKLHLLHGFSADDSQNIDDQQQISN